MAGIYIHIPYCKQACHYCDFHFSTSLKTRAKMIKAICTEIELRKTEVEQPIETIYFGGGTPSLLDENEFHQLFDTLKASFDLSKLKECTIECNPDDISTEKMLIIKKFPFNRLSIGVQTFNSDALQMLNRAHNSTEATKSIEIAQHHGFTNITCDLIYGIPSISNSEFKNDVDTLLSYNIPHISAYCLTIEEKTALKKLIETSQIQAPIEDDAISQYDLLKDSLEKANYVQYEISNFAQPNMEAVHNTNYWKGKEYLGVGPSAHSYNVSQRSFNVCSNHKYINSLAENKLPIEREQLSLTDNINDYILTRLRTIWGIDIKELKSLFSYDIIAKKKHLLSEYQQKEWLVINNNCITLSKKGSLMADEIAMELFEN